MRVKADFAICGKCKQYAKRRDNFLGCGDVDFLFKPDAKIYVTEFCPYQFEHLISTGEIDAG